MAFEFKLPDIGEGVVEGEIVQWLVKEGDLLEEDQPMVEIMTDKATVELPSPRKGRVASRNGKAGDIVNVGDVLIVIDEESAAAPSKAPPSKLPPQAEPEAPTPSRPSPAPTPSVAAASKGKALATPAVRREARQMGIDLAGVPGSGPGGRVLREDLKAYQAGPSVPAAASPPARPAALVEDEVVPYRAIRKKIGDNMALSKRTAAHFTYVEETDMTALVRLRKQYQAMPQSQDVKLTYLPFIVKAVVKGIQRYPIVNSSLDEQAGEIRIKKRCNIGIATSTDSGLLVPVVKDADRKGVLELAAEIAQLAEAARQGRSRLEDLQDSTFTITSLGALGGIMATPVINYPEVAILGVHKIRPQPVVREGEIVVRQMMNLSISLDHRVVDGATGAEFLNYLIPLLENPGLLLL